jgi:hypothetical protein
MRNSPKRSHKKEPIKNHRAKNFNQGNKTCNWEHQEQQEERNFELHSRLCKLTKSGKKKEKEPEKWKKFMDHC